MRLQEANRPSDVTTSYAPPVEEQVTAVEDRPLHAADLEVSIEDEEPTSSVQVTLDTPDKPSTQVRKTKDTQLRNEE